MTQPSAVELWDALKAWYAEHLPEALETLNPGASEGAITEFENELKRELGRGLPQGLRAIYLQNDGQDWATTICGMFFGVAFLSLAEVHSNWHGWLDIAQEPFYADMIEFSSFYPAAAIQHKYAVAGWIPFAHDIAPKHLVATYLRRYHHLKCVRDTSSQTERVADQMIPAIAEAIISALTSLPAPKDK